MPILVIIKSKEEQQKKFILKYFDLYVILLFNLYRVFYRGS